VASRPIFLVDVERSLVSERSVQFTWSPGLAASQKRKNIEALHVAARAAGIDRLLEVSTKSHDPLGVALSAFNLRSRSSDGRRVPLECVYQASKVFAHGGPYSDLIEFEPRDARRDPRLSSSGALIGFEYDGQRYSNDPPSAYYDWIYFQALSDNPTLFERLCQFRAFSDIEFNPKRSISSQARSCAIAVGLCLSELHVSTSTAFPSFCDAAAELQQQRRSLDSKTTGV
jgi:hypothetical protein